LIVTLGVAVIWIFRSSWWVLIPALFGLVIVYVACLVSTSRSLFDLTWGGLGRWVAWAGAEAIRSVPWAVEGAVEAGPTLGRSKARTLVRGSLITLPVLGVITALLASADPIFADLLQPDVSFPRLAVRVELFVLGSLFLSAALYVTRAGPRAEPRGTPRMLGSVEAIVILGGIAAVLLAFVLVQLGAGHGVGHETLAARGIAVADYARSGYFQLLAVVLITSLTLVVVDAFRRGTAERRTLERVLSSFIVLLALAVVVVSMQRLTLYVDAYGLTMLRLSCVPAAAWMSIVLLLIGTWTVVARWGRHWLPGMALVTLLLAIFGFAVVNPESFVVSYNVSMESTTPTDIEYLATLSDDAIPTLVASLDSLSQPDAFTLRTALCQRTQNVGEWSTWSLSKQRADHALARLCGEAAG
jgi:hypothetical protein